MADDLVRARTALEQELADETILVERREEVEAAMAQAHEAEAVLEAALRVADGAPDAAALRVAAGRAKARCGEAAVEITREAIQLHGGIGVTDEHHAHLLLKHAWLVGKLFGTKRALLGRLLDARVED